MVIRGEAARQADFLEALHRMTAPIRITAVEWTRGDAAGNRVLSLTLEVFIEGKRTRDTG